MKAFLFSLDRKEIYKPFSDSYPGHIKWGQFASFFKGLILKDRCNEHYENTSTLGINYALPDEAKLQFYRNECQELPNSVDYLSAFDEVLMETIDQRPEDYLAGSKYFQVEELEVF